MQPLMNELKNPMLLKYAQVIPSEMMQVLKESASQKGVSLDVEIAARIMATMVEPRAFGENVMLNAILNRDFTEDDAFAECKRNRQRWLYTYEMEKLRLFMKFEKNLPREIKESFTMINVKEAMAIIKEELKNESNGDEE